MRDEVNNPACKIGFWTYHRVQNGKIPHMDAQDFKARCDMGARISHLCESPIEEVMNCAMVTICVDGQFIEWADDPLSQGDRSDVPAVAWLQKNVGEYRADCLVRVQSEQVSRFVVIEFDGHDFHERTKAQARRDRSRDRWLTANGYSVLRFTGSEIWSEPDTCAEEIEAFLQSQFEQIRAQLSSGKHK